MNDLISRQDAIDAIEDNLGDSVCERIAINILKCLPSAEKTGKWIFDKNTYSHGVGCIRCSECGHITEMLTNYCSDCGCKMEV